MIAVVPVGIAHELADEAPGHSLTRCGTCGVALVSGGECAACVDVALRRGAP